MRNNSTNPVVRSRTLGAALFAATAVTLTACTVPTDAPILEQRWNVPAQTTTIGVADLLPSSVRIANNAFTIDVTAPAPITRTLYADCAQCAAANGLTVPKPAFTASASTTTNIPSDVASATLTAGQLTIAIRNNYNFDPIRPAAGVNGTLTVRVSNGTTTLGTTTVSGATQSLAPGATLNVNVPLSGAISGATPITVAVDVNSPAGDNVTMTSTQSITITPSITGLTVASAQVRIAARTISTTSELELGDIDSSIGEKIDSAYVRLSVTNPFAVSGTLTVSLEAAGATTVTRTIQLVPSSANNEQIVALSGPEIQSFIGKTVTLRVSGPVSAPAPVTVTPSQVVSVVSRLDLFIALGR